MKARILLFKGGGLEPVKFIIPYLGSVGWGMVGGWHLGQK